MMESLFTVTCTVVCNTITAFYLDFFPCEVRLCFDFTS